MTTPPDLPADTMLSYDPNKTWIAGEAMPASAARSGSATPATGARWSILEVEESAVNSLYGDRPAFHLRRVVGEGGYGQVWEALQTSLGRTIALKKLRPALFQRHCGAKDAIRVIEGMFRQEAVTAAQLDHPNILPVYDLGESSDTGPVMAMKLARGKSWDKVIHEDWNTIPLAEFLHKHIGILVSVSQAAAFAHSRGIVHRDLKPSQVMLGEFGEVLLMDWGLAMLFDEDPKEPDSGNLRQFLPTRSTASCPSGTIAFMAPEQTFRTADRIGPWTDIFLLGGTLYYLLTGTPPYVGASATELFARAALCEVQPPLLRAPQRQPPRELSDICLRALSDRPADRHHSARDLLADLQGWLTGSSHRKESLAVTAVVKDRLHSSPSSYQDYSECLAELERALALWADNPEIPPLRTEATTAFAKTALHFGDLVLARIQAVRLDPDAAGTQEILDELSRREDKQRRQHRTRRNLIVSVAALGTFVVISTVLFSLYLGTINDQLKLERDQALYAKQLAEHSRLRASKARQDSEDLLSFMLRDLYDSLTQTGQLELLEGATEQARDYFERLDPQERTPETLFNHSLAQQRVGQVLNAIGRTGEAEGPLLEAVALARESVAQAPDSPGFRSRLAAALGDLARFRQIINDPEAAESHLREALGIMERLLEEDPQRSSEAIARFSLNLALIISSRPDNAEAEVHLARAMELYQLEQQLESEDPAVVYELSRALNDASNAYLSLGQLSNSVVTARQSYNLALRYDELVPSNIMRLSLVQKSAERLATSLINAGELAEAEAVLRRSLAASEALISIEPRRVANRFQRLTVLSRLARIYHDQSRSEDAILIQEDLIEQYRALAELDPSEMMILRQYHVARLNLVGLLGSVGRITQALALVTELEAVFAEDAARNPRDVDVQRNYGYIFYHQARLRQRQGDLEGSVAALDGMIRLQEAMLLEGPENNSARRDLATALGQRAEILHLLDRLEEAWKDAQQALELFRIVQGAEPQDQPGWIFTGRAFLVGSHVLKSMDLGAERTRLLDEGISLLSAVRNPINLVREQLLLLLVEADRREEAEKTADTLELAGHPIPNHVREYLSPGGDPPP